MKIVHVIYSMEMGGAEMLVAQLGRIQRDAGHEVTVCTYSMLGPLGELLREEGLTVRVLGQAPVWKTMLRYTRLFRALRPDVVHCHNPAPTLQAAMGGRLAGARVISTRHSLVAPPYDHAAELKYSFVARLFVHYVAGICEVTCQNLRGAPLANPKQIVRAYNGVARLERAEPVAADQGSFVLLFIGRLVQVKDLPTILRAFALAVRQEPRLRLWIVGDGPERTGLDQLARDLQLGERVRFWGQRLDTAAFFAAAGCFVMSSVSEGLPMSLLQSMSLGLPAIVTGVGGMEEVVSLSGGGVRVPIADAPTMAAAMVRMATDEAARVAFGQKAQHAFHRYFTLQEMHEAYLHLYTS